MPAGHIKIEIPLVTVQEEVGRRFIDIPYNEFMEDNQDLPQRFKINCVFVHATASQKKIKVLKPSRNFSRVTQKEGSTNDRFIVFGVARTPHVILCFTLNSEESVVYKKAFDTRRAGRILVRHQPLNKITKIQILGCIII